MPSRRDDDAMSREALLAEIRRLRELVAASPNSLMHDLDVHRDELLAGEADLRESRAMLELSRDAYAALFDFAPIGYAILDATGVVTDVNLTMGRLIGIERVRLVAFPFFTFVAHPHRRRFLDYLRRCRTVARGPAANAERAGIEIELDLCARDGRTVPVLLVTRVNHSAELRTTEFHLSATDLTQRKRLEAEAAQRDAERRAAEQQEQLARTESESKDHFIAILSHELRTPLAPIRFAVASLRHAGALPDALRRALDIIDRNVEHEARMIEDLLDVTRIVQNKLHLAVGLVDVHAMIDEVASTHAPETERAGVRVELQLSAGQHHVEGDEGRLRQVLLNLVKNACAHTPAGGNLTIRTANPKPGRLVIEVRDDGRGIERNALDRIFRPFEQRVDPQRPSTGLGLGLSICRGIVEGHRGTIVASSNGPGTGATFTIELPAVAAEMASVPARPADAVASPEAPEATNGVKVLLVEDNQDSAEAMAAMLEMFGYRVRVAGTVQAALRAAEQEFDVLVSDIGLPDGNGRDLIRELATRRPVRGIALTGYGTGEDVVQNSRAGFSRHLVKPVNPDKLIATINELMHAPAATGTESGGARRG